MLGKVNIIPPVLYSTKHRFLCMCVHKYHNLCSVHLVQTQELMFRTVCTFFRHLYYIYNCRAHLITASILSRCLKHLLARVILSKKYRARISIALLIKYEAFRRLSSGTNVGSGVGTPRDRRVKYGEIEVRSIEERGL